MVQADRPTHDLQTLIDAGRLKALQIRIFAICALVVFLDGIDSQSIGIVAPLLASDLNLDKAQLGLIFSIAQVGATVGALLFGPLADRFGRKPILILATAVIAAFTYLTAVSPTFGLLLSVRLVAGVGLAAAIPPALALTSEYAPGRLRGALVTAIFAAYPLGGAVAGFFSAWLLALFDWRMVFYVGAILPVVVMGLIALFVPESLLYLFATGKGRGRRVEGVLRQLAPDVEPAQVRTSAVVGQKKPSIPLAALFKGRLMAATLLLWGVYFFAFATTKIMVVWFPSIMKTAGFDISAASTALGFFNIGATVGMAGSGMLVDRLGPFRALAPALAAAGLCVLGMGLASTSLTLVIVLATLIGVFIGIGGSGAHAVAVAIYTPEMRSSGLGFGLAASRFGQVVSPTVVGLMLNAGLGSQAVYFTVALSPVLAALMVVLLRWSSLGAPVAAAPAPAE